MILQIKGGSVEIDEEDLQKVSSLKWRVSSNGYAVWRGRDNGRNMTIRMHRLITDCPQGKFIDHINHNRLDNRRINLRIATHSENMRNKTDQGKGYWYHKQNKNWIVEINSKHRGTFQTEQDAAEFAQQVRLGKADFKPRSVQTTCSKGHSLHDAYIVGKKRICRQCQADRSRKYFKNKMDKLKEI